MDFWFVKKWAEQGKFPVKTEEVNLTDFGLEDDSTFEGTKIKSKYFQFLVSSLKSRHEIIRTIDEIRSMEIVQTIIDYFVDDGFNSMARKQLFTVVYRDENDKKGSAQIQKEINTFLKELKVYDLIGDILEELILYGEYFLSVETQKGKGIVEINDNVDLVNTIGVYDSKGPVKFLLYNEKEVRSHLFELPPEQIVHFCLLPRKIKFRNKKSSKNKINSLFFSKEYCRVGRSVLMSVIATIKQANILQIAALAKILKKSLTPNLIGITASDTNNPAEIDRITKKYQYVIGNVVSKTFGVNELTPEQIVRIASEVKVIPIFPNTKGRPEVIELSRSDTDNLGDNFDKTRRAIAQGAGLPLTALSLSESGTQKTEDLRSFSRYSRKLIAIQNAVGQGAKDLVVKHMRAKGRNLSVENLVVEFKPITSVDILDDMEWMVAAGTSTETLANSLGTVLNTIGINAKVDSEKVVELFNSIYQDFPNMRGLLQTMTAEEIKKKEKKQQEGGY